MKRIIDLLLTQNKAFRGILRAHCCYDLYNSMLYTYWVLYDVKNYAKCVISRSIHFFFFFAILLTYAMLQ